MLTDVEVVSITPDPDATGVHAAMGVSAKLRVDRVGCRQRLLKQFVDVPWVCIGGGRQDQHTRRMHWLAPRLYGHHRRIQRIHPVHRINSNLVGRE